MDFVAQNLAVIRTNIDTFAKKYGRNVAEIKLLAITKAQSIENIKTAFEAGQNCFGESYVQEALAKINALKDYEIEWHFVGPIQSNKTKLIAENFSWVHSLSRLKIAQRLNDQRPANLPVLNVCIEVNLANEASKSGVLLTEILPLAIAIKSLSRLKLRGLMAIPEPSVDFDTQRKNFKILVTAFFDLKNQGFDIDTLSMGMSDDYGAAIAEGATIIRIGSGIFGDRF